MTDLTLQSASATDGKSSVVITRLLSDLPGGVALDLSLTPGVTTLRAGHVVLVKDGKYFAAPFSGTAYAAFGDKKPAGILVADILASVPLGSVMTAGQVRSAACPFAITDAIKSALPRIDFI